MNERLESLSLSDTEAWDSLINEATDAAHYLDKALKSIPACSDSGFHTISIYLVDDILEAKHAFECLATAALAQREELQEIAEFERQEASRR